MSCAWKKYVSILFVLIIGVPAFAQTFRGASAPGIGYGEPFNIQFALKVSF